MYPPTADRLPLPPQTFRGENTYAILRAPRSGSTESLVLSAPYRTPSGPLPDNGAAVALMIALARYFRREYGEWVMLVHNWILPVFDLFWPKRG